MGKRTYFRIEQLVSSLEGLHYGMTLDAMVEKLEVSRRTVQRYVLALLTEGWIREADPDLEGRKRWQLTRSAKKRIPLQVSATELLAQRLALQTTAPLVEGTELEEALRSIACKVEAAVPDVFKEFASRAKFAFPDFARPGRGTLVAPEIIEDILQAIIDRKVIKAEYRAILHGGKEARTHVLKPLAAFSYRGALYIGAIVGETENMGRFRLDRFTSVQVTKETFEPPKGFSAKEFMGRTFGVFDDTPMSVRVRFASTVAAVVGERIWHPTQTVTPTPDGGVEVAFTASGWPEIRAWVLSYGGFAELLEPAARRAELAGELASTLAKYESAGTTPEPMSTAGTRT